MSEPIIGQIQIFPINRVPNFLQTPQGANFWMPCQGQIENIMDFQAAYSILSTMYGGDGRVNFGLPGMAGTYPIGFGQQTDGSSLPEGQMAGSPTVTLTEDNLPPHNHDTTALYFSDQFIQVNTSGQATITSTATSSPSATATSTAVSTATSTVSCAGSLNTGNSNNPTSRYPVQASQPTYTIYSAAANTTMAPDAVQTTVNTTVNTQLNVALSTTAQANLTNINTQISASPANLSISGTTGSTGGGAPLTLQPPGVCLLYFIAVFGIYPTRP